MALVPIEFDADIETATTTATYTGTDNTSHSETVYFFKYGEVKQVIFDLPKFPTTTNVIVSFPSGFAPTTIMARRFWCMTQNTRVRLAYMYNGKLSVASTDDSGGGCYGYATYI